MFKKTQRICTARCRQCELEIQIETRKLCVVNVKFLTICFDSRDEVRNASVGDRCAFSFGNDE